MHTHRCNRENISHLSSSRDNIFPNAIRDETRLVSVIRATLYISGKQLSASNILITSLEQNSLARKTEKARDLEAFERHGSSSDWISDLSIVLSQRSRDVSQSVPLEGPDRWQRSRGWKRWSAAADTSGTAATESRDSGVRWHYIN